MDDVGHLLPPYPGLKGRQHGDSGGKVNQRLRSDMGCWRRERDLNSRGNRPTRFPVARTTRLCDLGFICSEPDFSFNHHPLVETRLGGGAKGLKGTTSSP